MKFIFVPELDADDVDYVLRKARYKLPDNVRSSGVARWHCGLYYGYGGRQEWVPVGKYGGIATRPFDRHSVKFPARIDAALRAMLAKKKARERYIAKRGEESNV